MKYFLILLSGLISQPSAAQVSAWVTEDLQKIFVGTPFEPYTVVIQSDAKLKPSDIKLQCSRQKLTLTVAPDKESDAKVYWAVHKMGFLFPHPRWTVAPKDTSGLKKICGKRLRWDPVFKQRGFHLHLMHPSEWVDGFLGDQPEVAFELVRWVKRNFQNTLQIQLLRTASVNKDTLSKAIKEAHRAGLYVGLDVSFSNQQQKSYYLIPLYSVFFNYKQKEFLLSGLDELDRTYGADFYAFELGSTEFTSTPYKQTLAWIEWASAHLKAKGRDIFVKVHSSLNQADEAYGNFNFLPRFSSKDVGVLPHTVFFYGLNDKNVPMYGRKDYADLKQFILEENSKRKIFYYPETSYYVGLDIDMPMLLTDYLVARADDSLWLRDKGISGQINFSTGHEMGYWLFDWNFALQSVAEYSGDPLAALKLLGEDVDLWKKIIAFQTEYFKDKQLIQLLTSANLMDELPFFRPIHKRILLRDLRGSGILLKEKIKELEAALSHRPNLEGIKNLELKILLQVTWNRIDHVLDMAKFLDSGKKDFLEDAKNLRTETLILLADWQKSFARYPLTLAFEKRENPTSYLEGYGYTALRLHFWEREEGIIAGNRWNPFYANIYDPIELLF